VGARRFLIAYNIFLNTADVEIAKKVAKAVRFSGGGLRFVKAAGFLVRGQAQVSMNLTDFEQTPLHRVFEAVKSEAARYGTAPQSSEIVGLIPKKALEQSAEWFLQIEKFDASLILENRLAGVMGGKMAVGGIRAGVEPFIEQLAAPTATPGGGSAAAAAGAMAAGLAAMVATMSRGKKAYAQYEGQLSEVILRLAQIREELKSSIDADAESFQSVMEAYKQAKAAASAEGRVTGALKQATNVPLVVAERASEVLKLIDVLRPITNRNMKSDLVAGAALARAAVEGALANVEINLESLSDTEFVAQSRARARVLKA
jgi:glutamate formiminotransferase/formiminotetrahydrofolate cyclodeaminase